MQTQLLLNDTNSKDVLQELIQCAAITKGYSSHRIMLGLVYAKLPKTYSVDVRSLESVGSLYRLTPIAPH